MKRWIAVILVFSMCITLTGCKTADIMGRFAEATHEAVIGYFHDLKDYYKDQLHQAWVDITPDFMTEPAEMQHPTDIGRETLPDASKPAAGPQETVPGISEGPLIDTGEPVTGPQETVPYEEPPAEEGFWPSLWDSVKEKGSSAWQACTDWFYPYPLVEEKGSTVSYYNEDKEKIDDATLDQFCQAKYGESNYIYLSNEKQKEILRLYCIYLGTNPEIMESLSELKLLPLASDNGKGAGSILTADNFAAVEEQLGNAGSIWAMIEFIENTPVVPNSYWKKAENSHYKNSYMNGLVEKALGKASAFVGRAQVVLRFNEMVSGNVEDPAEGCMLFTELIEEIFSMTNAEYLPGSQHYAEAMREISASLKKMLVYVDIHEAHIHTTGILSDYSLFRNTIWSKMAGRADWENGPALKKLADDQKIWARAMAEDFAAMEDPYPAPRTDEQQEEIDELRSLYLKVMKDYINYRINYELSGKHPH